ncbi:VOC family protein [Salipaludibacillus aurantiacus]|uniref:Lactoylglutathione lyase n=1 Tax=Salipaludibacillus aurantiacus TaxID=1601833 RepID=A0A1H9Q9K8_9BACI|nr:VOC family protein [Salipaludibacillus aurantiacus]SER57088.1 lactoylglutathione lyase [Salipaludibacillus aurantiacus]
MLKKVHHVGIEVKNLAGTANLLEKIGGFNVVTEFIFQSEKIVFLSTGDILIELAESKHLDEQPVHLAFETDDLEEAAAYCERLQLKLAEGPFHLENNWKTAFFEDETGRYFEIIETGDSQ